MASKTVVGIVSGTVIALFLGLQSKVIHGWEPGRPPATKLVSITTAFGHPLRSIFDGIQPDPRNLRVWAAVQRRPEVRTCRTERPSKLERALGLLGLSTTVHAQGNPGCEWPCNAAGCGAWLEDTACQGNGCSGQATNGYAEGFPQFADQANGNSHCRGSNCAGCWATYCDCPTYPPTS